MPMPGRAGVELIGHLAAGNYPRKVVVMSGSDPRYSPDDFDHRHDARPLGRWDAGRNRAVAGNAFAEQIERQVAAQVEMIDPDETIGALHRRR
jgi:hypothetical protein